MGALRFLRQAAAEGLITAEEHERHKHRILLCAVRDGRSAHVAAPPATVLRHRPTPAQGSPPSGEAIEATNELMTALANVAVHCTTHTSRAQEDGGCSEAVLKSASDVVAPAEAGGKADAQHRRCRFAFDRSGINVITNERMTPMDPLEVAVDSLWEDAHPRGPLRVDVHVQKEKQQAARTATRCARAPTAAEVEVQYPRPLPCEGCAGVPSRPAHTMRTCGMPKSITSAPSAGGGTAQRDGAPAVRPKASRPAVSRVRITVHAVVEL